MQDFLARRMARGPYWLLVLINSVAALFLIWSIGFVVRHLMVDSSGRPHLITNVWLVSPLVPALLHLPIFIGTIWRLHDTGHRSWPAWLLFSYPVCLTFLAHLAPAIIQATGANMSMKQGIMALYGVYGFQLVLTGVLIWTIYLCCLRGDWGANAYGPSPGGGMPTYPGDPDESGETVTASVASSAAAPASSPARIAPPQKRTFGRRTG
jgi:uncharacterized membrane protein YhaH (DUF805 family)